MGDESRRMSLCNCTKPPSSGGFVYESKMAFRTPLPMGQCPIFKQFAIVICVIILIFDVDII